MAESVDPFDEYTLTMPFVVCKSHSGPYEDDAFVAGWQACLINERLSGETYETSTESVLVALLPQLDLIAMKYGYVMHTEPHRPEDTYVDVTFEYGGE